MKKLLVFLLTACLAMTMFAGCTGQTSSQTSSGDPTANRPTTASGQLIIGQTTELTGDWEVYWANGASDNDVLTLTTGYSPVAVKTGVTGFVIDETVVKKFETKENDSGTKTFTVELHQDLVYSDGVGITAKDYVARVLLVSHKAMELLGAANISLGSDFVGYDEYNEFGAPFTGVRLLDTYKFSFEVAADLLPYYYDLTYISVEPLPTHQWFADGIEVKDDGEGAYLAGTIIDGDSVSEAFNTKLQAARYASADRVCSGPYKIESFDTATSQAVLVINDKYKGDYRGLKALISKLIVVKSEAETQMDLLSTGGIDFLLALSEGPEIKAGLSLVDTGNFTYSHYLRNGYGKIVLSCDFGPTQFVKVRHGLAHLLNRPDFASAFTGGYGAVVHGPYGLGQWMYQQSEQELTQTLNKYEYSLDTAIDCFEEAGFTLGEDGNTYISGIRYKDVTGMEGVEFQHNITVGGKTLMPLIIEWMCSLPNAVADLIDTNFMQNPDLTAAGAKVNKTDLSWNDLLGYLYRSEGKFAVPTYNMFNLATGFTAVYDQSYYWTPDYPTLNQPKLFDAELEKLSKDMIRVASGDDEAFLKIWVDFIQKWNELLPEIPLYSNDYHDIYTPKLKGYTPSSGWDIFDGIVEVWLED